jgi:uncharacterized membrane protein YeiB
LALAVFAAQIAFSRYWLVRHTMGPIERVWRTLSRQSAGAGAAAASGASG